MIGTIELCLSIPRFLFRVLTTTAIQFINTTNMAKSSSATAKTMRAVIIYFLTERTRNPAPGWSRKSSHSFTGVRISDLLGFFRTARKL
ncbi:hypothetical protein HZ994_09415 [Akkermansiaceae bacterium]|nr:hypothetical protein HZ994_09415 [Akkermansiaceae bacterium]